jgi:hypothetical protein
MRQMRFALSLVLAALLTPLAAFADDHNPFLGEWACTSSNGYSVWLGVTEESGEIEASVLWGFGSVLPAARTERYDDMMVATWIQRSERKSRTDDAIVRQTKTVTCVITLTSDDHVRIVRIDPGDDGIGMRTATGTRTAPMGPKPDLAKVSFGDPITLFNGNNLEGWKLIEPESANGWSAEDGILINRVDHDEEKDVSYGNLRTVDEFEDFNLTLETRLQEDGNSGIYLRGIYEIQVADSYGQDPESHGMGSLYSRIAPEVNAALPHGEWQTFDITLVNRYLTVKLNGKTIIDNEPTMGCTGGALWSDPSRPGPIYLQGDHTGNEYRNIVLRPVSD